MKNIYKAFICILALTVLAPSAEAYSYGYNTYNPYQYHYQNYDYRDFSTRPNYTYSSIPTIVTRLNFTNSYVPFTNSRISYSSYVPIYYR